MWKMWIKISLIAGVLITASQAAKAESLVPTPAQKPLAEQLLAAETDQSSEMTAPFPAAKPVLASLPAKSAEKSKIKDDAFVYEYTKFNLNRALSAADAALYKQIFELQSQGDFTEADKKIADLSDTRLLGHVLRERYLHENYKSQYAELQNWLNHYADHPGAQDIYKLAKRKTPRPSDTGTLAKPQTPRSIAVVREPTVRWAKPYQSTKKRNEAQHKQVFNLSRTLHRHVRKGNLQAAASLLTNDSRVAYMDEGEKDIALSKIANAYFYRGDTAQAYKIAKETLKRSGRKVPVSAWVSGLVAWKNGHYKSAATFFEIAAKSQYASGWMSSAGAFWAARAHMKSGNFKNVSALLNKAYEHPRTFYGLLATRALGKEFEFNWSLPQLRTSPEGLLSTIPAGVRAIALVQTDRLDLAQDELLHIDINDNEELSNAILVYAQHARLPKLSVRIGNVLSSEENGFFDAAMYPAGPWKPESGYNLDPALLYAILRQESHFNPYANSPSGAKGLMQIMPATARAMGLKSSQDLFDPSVNLEIAQIYIDKLFENRHVNGDIARMLVAYNAGPGNLSKWLKQMGDVEDPLLFIESIPIAETRAYVERVLSNYWIYQRRQGLKTPSLTELAQGKWISYAEMQKIQPFQTASN